MSMSASSALTPEGASEDCGHRQRRSRHRMPHRLLLRFDPGFLGCRRPALRLAAYKRREGFGRVTQRLDTRAQDLGLHVRQAYNAADLGSDLIDDRHPTRWRREL